MIRRIADFLLHANLVEMISKDQIQKDISMSMCTLSLICKCLEIPQVIIYHTMKINLNLTSFQICCAVHSGTMFHVLQPLIAPTDFIYSDGGAFRRRAIQCAVMLALFGQPQGQFHPWHEIIENTLLRRLKQRSASAMKSLKGDRLIQDLFMEQKDLIEGLMYILKDSNHDREPLPSVAVAFFSNIHKLIGFVESVSRLNAFTEIEDFQAEHQQEEWFGLAVVVTASLCRLLQAVCSRFSLSCTVEETRDLFFNFVQGALPMEGGLVTTTPVVDDSFEIEDDFGFDDTPSKSSSVNENDPLSTMYMAGIELEATIVKHASIQVAEDIQKARITSIMGALYRKSTLESRVKDQILTCIPLYYNLSCFSKTESDFFVQHLLEWNQLDKILDNVPSAIVAVEFMEKMISSDSTCRDARMPFLDCTFN